MSVFTKLSELEHEAAAFGFRWETPQQILEQIQSECAEITAHLPDSDYPHRTKLQEEMGDLLHAVLSLCVFCDFDPEHTLQTSIAKFERRFKQVQALALKQGLTTLNGKSFDELMAFWDDAKKLVG